MTLNRVYGPSAILAVEWDMACGGQLYCSFDRKGSVGMCRAHARRQASTTDLQVLASTAVGRTDRVVYCRGLE